MTLIEEHIESLTTTVGTAIEGLAVLIIAGAIARASWSYVNDLIKGGSDKIAVRLTLGKTLAIALEFLLAADILRTAVAPSWEDIGKLGAIAVLRTMLNYFLEREIKQTDV